MRKNKGAISIFALLSMMFFLIFIMVAYNNVAQKGKMQVETEEILVDYYKSPQNATEIVKGLDGGNVTVYTNTTLLKEKEQQNKVTTDNNGNFIYSNGKIYKIQ